MLLNTKKTINHIYNAVQVWHISEGDNITYNANDITYAYKLNTYISYAKLQQYQVYLYLLL
jgi:hypothetical protein